MSTEQSILTLVDLYAAERTSRGKEPRRRIRLARDRVAHGLSPGVPKAVAARVLGVSVPTLDKWVARGRVRTVHGSGRRVLVDREHLVAFAVDVQALRELGQGDGILGAAIQRLKRTDPQYRADFADLYGDSLTAVERDDLAPLVIPDTLGPDD